MREIVCLTTGHSDIVLDERDSLTTGHSDIVLDERDSWQPPFEILSRAGDNTLF